MLAGYPVAYLLVIAQPGARALMMALILLPFWTNILVRCYAWMLVLQTKGLVNTALIDWFGVIASPLPLLFNLTGVIIGMVHYLLPIAILTLYAGLKSIDLRLVRAAQGLGANPVRAFLEVFVPLSLPSARATTMLIFVLSLGFYVTPALLGGRTEITIAMLVSTYFSDALNWGFGSALAVLLLAVTLLGLGIYFALEQGRTRLAAP
jgi:putative spermidine/putrescine transport system permease protein/spermidine/putrescine transport system permease protein